MKQAGISLVLDTEREDYHITAAPGYDSRRLASLLQWLEGAGYVPLDDDEDTGELKGESVRIYLRSEE